VREYRLPAEVRARVMGELAMAWDGQWFLKVMEECGLDTAVRINARVRAAQGRLEMRAMLRALGKERADDLTDALAIIRAYTPMLMGDTVVASFEVLPDGRCRVLIDRCKAYEGSRRAGLPRSDQACLGCPGLWEAWLSVLLGDPPPVLPVRRMGMGDERCEYIIGGGGGGE